VAEFLITRVLRYRDDLIFMMDLRVLPENAGDATQARVRVIDRENMSTGSAQAVECQVLVGDNEAYRTGLRKHDVLFAYVDEHERVLSYAFALLDTPTTRILQLPDGVPLIGNCYTIPEARGRRLYPSLLICVCRELATRGHRQAAINCAADNVASIRGIERAGFRRVRHVETWVALSRVPVWRRVRAAP